MEGSLPWDPWASVPRYSFNISLKSSKDKPFQMFDETITNKEFGSLKASWLAQGGEFYTWNGSSFSV